MARTGDTREPPLRWKLWLRFSPIVDASDWALRKYILCCRRAVGKFFRPAEQ